MLLMNILTGWPTIVVGCRYLYNNAFCRSLDLRHITTTVVESVYKPAKCKSDSCMKGSVPILMNSILKYFE